MTRTLDWTQFKANVAAQGFSVRYLDITDAYWLGAYDTIGVPIAQCKLIKGTADCAEFIATFKGGWSVVLISPTQTLSEVKNLRLQAIRMKADVDAFGICEATLLVPATGVNQGRIIDWGEGWMTGTSHDDDCMELVAIDMLIATVWTQVSGYTDEDVAATNSGMWFPPKPTTLEIYPLGYYGDLMGGLRIRLRGKCGGTAAQYTGRGMRANIAWGKADA